MTKVFVGMSGGVDSSVAAWILIQQGFQVEGLFMKNWELDDTSNHCPAALDLQDAQSVCDALNIPLHTVNFSEAYWQRVFSHFLDEYEKGRTPNPDVLCNKEIKFDAFLNHAINLGADFIATGHYARVKDGELFKAKDRNKDQTYFLHAVNRDAFQKVMFPIGDFLKSEVRAMALEKGLITHAKKDSTGICFIGEKRFKSFLNEFILARPGNIQTLAGETLGRHDGLMFYTLGQRQGLQIGGISKYPDEPWYVADKIIQTNTLVVVQGSSHPMLYAQGLLCSPIHWLSRSKKTLPHACHAKIRYRQAEVPCLIAPLNDGQHCVMFSEPQRAVTPGQYIVFYDKNQCIGGATIEQMIR